MNLTDTLTIFAILLGPIIAIFITRLMDQKAEEKRRRFELFKNLMQTRGIRIDPIHVASLNIVELEFYRDRKVREAFRAYIDHLSSPMPSGGKEDEDRYFDQRSDLFMDLMHEMGNAVGYKFDKRELDRRSYVPKGWNDDQILHRRNALLVNQLLEGQRPMPVSNFLAQGNPYPKPPEVDED